MNSNDNNVFAIHRNKKIYACQAFFIIYFLTLFDILCMGGHMFNKKYTKKFQMGNKCHHCIKVLFVIHVSAVAEAENG